MEDIDRVILDIEKRHYRRAGMKANAITEETGLSPTRYAQRLVRLLADPEALAADPVLIHRLQRIVEARRRTSV
jgi:hypothetical protein